MNIPFLKSACNKYIQCTYHQNTTSSNNTTLSTLSKTLKSIQCKFSHKSSTTLLKDSINPSLLAQLQATESNGTIGNYMHEHVSQIYLTLRHRIIWKTGSNPTAENTSNFCNTYFPALTSLSKSSVTDILSPLTYRQTVKITVICQLVVIRLLSACFH